MPEEDMYGGGGAPVEEPQPEQPKPEGEEKGSGQTFLLNKDIDPSFKVGEEMVVKIVAVHEKEYEVEYAKEPATEEGAPKEGMAPEATEGAPGGGSAPDSMY